MNDESTLTRVCSDCGHSPHECVCNRSEVRVRTFDTGATRDTDEGKYDYEAFLSPLVIERYGKYMHKCRFQSDGSLRDGDNWQKGIPTKQYIKSAWRHFLAWWLCHRYGMEYDEKEGDILCALLFNIMGYLHERIKHRAPIGYDEKV